MMKLLSQDCSRSSLNYIQLQDPCVIFAMAAWWSPMGYCTARSRSEHTEKKVPNEGNAKLSI